ncbi:hypothetical protein BJV82DRAFT_616905 [Fennellomyces sp. T-0311]|nr:hypothetical protein BJV82DRAFT_616905 [Fennellomyces sp. T-0311]
MSEETVLAELKNIYHPDHIAKNAFFREMLEQDPERWISLKKISVIKQMKPLVNGDLNLLIRAVESGSDAFELNEQKTKLRDIPKAQEEQKEEEAEEAKVFKFEEHMLAVNRRSIYAKGFAADNEPGRKDILALFSPFGRVMHIKYRRDDERKFKGSIFVEFENTEIAQEVVAKNLEYQGKELLVMLKSEYVEMKAKEKYAGNSDFKPDGPLKVSSFLEFQGADEMKPEQIKDLVKPIGSVVHVYQPRKQKGSGVIEVEGIWPEEFLAKLVDNKLENLTFKVADDEARGKYIDDKMRLVNYRKQKKRPGNHRHQRGPKKQKT